MTYTQEDFDNDPAAQHFKRKVKGATAAPEAYLEAMDTIYEVALTMNEGDVTLAQGTYEHLRDGHIALMADKLKAPWMVRR